MEAEPAFAEQLTTALQRCVPVHAASVRVFLFVVTLGPMGGRTCLRVHG